MRNVTAGDSDVFGGDGSTHRYLDVGLIPIRSADTYR